MAGESQPGAGPDASAVTPQQPRPITEIGKDYFAQRDAKRAAATTTNTTSPQTPQPREDGFSLINRHLTPKSQEYKGRKAREQEDQEDADKKRTDQKAKTQPVVRVETPPTPPRRIEQSVLVNTARQSEISAIKAREAYVQSMQKRQQAEAAVQEALNPLTPTERIQYEQLRVVSDQGSTFLTGEQKKQLDELDGKINANKPKVNHGEYQQLLENEEQAKQQEKQARRQLSMANDEKQRANLALTTSQGQSENARARSEGLTTRVQNTEATQQLTNINTRLTTLEQAVAQLQAQPAAGASVVRLPSGESLPIETVRSEITRLTAERAAVQAQLEATQQTAGQTERARQNGVQLEFGFVKPQQQELLTRPFAQLTPKERAARFSLIMDLSRESLGDMQQQAENLRHLKSRERRIIEGILSARIAMPLDMTNDVEALIQHNPKLSTDAQEVLRSLWNASTESTISEPWDARALSRAETTLNQLQQLVEKNVDIHGQSAMEHLLGFLNEYAQMDRKSPFHKMLGKSIPFVPRMEMKMAMATTNAIFKNDPARENMEHSVSFFEDPLSFLTLRGVIGRKSALKANEVALIMRDRSRFQITSEDPEVQVRQSMLRDIISSYYEGVQIPAAEPEEPATVETEEVVAPLPDIEPLAVAINPTTTTEVRAAGAAPVAPEPAPKTSEARKGIEVRSGELIVSQETMVNLLNSQAMVTVENLLKAGKTVTPDMREQILQEHYNAFADTLRKKGGLPESEITAVIEDLRRKEKETVDKISADVNAPGATEGSAPVGVSTEKMAEAARQAYDPATGKIDETKLQSLPARARDIVITGLTGGGLGFIMMLFMARKKDDGQQQTTQ